MKKLLVLSILFFTSPLLAGENLQFNNKQITLSSNQPKYTMTLNYPEIAHPTNIPEKRFNTLAKQWIMTQVAEFKKNASENDTNTIPKELKAAGSTLNLTYNLTSLPPRKLVSVRFSEEAYIAGSAHPSHKYYAFNYDLINNKKSILSDLFLNTSPYLQHIAQIASEKVTTQLNKSPNGQGGVEIFKEGLTPTPKNYEVWNITPNGLQITFNEYQVAAYVYGPQVITIPFEQLKNDLNPYTVPGYCIINHCNINSFASPNPKPINQ